MDRNKWRNVVDTSLNIWVLYNARNLFKSEELAAYQEGLCFIKSFTVTHIKHNIRIWSDISEQKFAVIKTASLFKTAINEYLVRYWKK